jgi:hypothetical protein
MSALSITSLREVLTAASLTDLQRATNAVFMTQMFQAVVMLLGMIAAGNARAGRENEPWMAAWPKITADTLSNLQDDPL